MGKKDEYQFNYLDDDFRFADQINGALFHGEQNRRRNKENAGSGGESKDTGGM